MMKKNFTKKLVVTKKDDENFQNLTKCWIYDNDYAYGNVKVRDNCHITEKYRGSHKEIVISRLNLIIEFLLRSTT